MKLYYIKDNQLESIDTKDTPVFLQPNPNELQMIQNKNNAPDSFLFFNPEIITESDLQIFVNSVMEEMDTEEFSETIEAVGKENENEM